MRKILFYTFFQVGVSSGTGYVIGILPERPVIAMDMEERMYALQYGNWRGSKGWHIAPDEKTVAYVKGRKYAPKTMNLIKKKLVRNLYRI